VRESLHRFTACFIGSTALQSVLEIERKDLPLSASVEGTSDWASEWFDDQKSWEKNKRRRN